MSTEGTAVAKAHPAASLILLRDSARGPEVLYLHRNPEIAFHGGYWVFPGGRIDATDYPDPARADEEAAACCAAVREAREEAGVAVDPGALRYVCHWTTPETLPKRFATWFFVAPAGGGAVRVDGDEIQDYRWLPPSEALRAQRSGEMRLAAPTYGLSSRLSGYPSVEAALAAVERWEPERLLGRIHTIPDGRVVLYRQDAGYMDGDLERPGPRHRLWMLESGWRYERGF